MNVSRRFFACCLMLGLGCAALVVGCSGPRGPMTVKNDDPAIKIPAIQADVQNRNRSDLPELVKSLEDEDPAVRFYAIEALRRLTGDNYGYIYYADEDARKPAVERWKQWLKQRGDN